MPGYAVIGDVDAVGEGVRESLLGERVGVLTVTGGYTEFLYWRSDRLIPVPAELDPAEAVPLILNYILYGTSFYFMGDKRPFLEDWATLFNLLREGKIKPVIAKKLPILEAAQANELLESGQVVGSVVLLTPEVS